jgi:hypothetical protein
MKKVIQQQQRDWWAEVRVRQRDWLYAGLLRNQAACGPLRCFDVCQRARGKCCLYVMSEKATGFDWKRSSVHTLRHAAGCEKYTGLRSDPPIEKRALAAGVPSAATGVACAMARELRATPLPERSRLLALLQTLEESAAIDVDALAASGVAKLVKTLRTRSDVPVMAALATELFASWKLVAKEAGVVKTGQSQKKRPKVER